MAQNRFYLTVARKKRQPQNDGYIALISQGSPQRGDSETIVLSVDIVKNRKEAEVWFEQQLLTRPWEKRQ